MNFHLGEDIIPVFLPWAGITGRHTQTHNESQQAFDDHGQHLTYITLPIMHGMTDLPSLYPIQALFRSMSGGPTITYRHWPTCTNSRY